jgi:hypothetical protein
LGGKTNRGAGKEGNSKENRTERAGRRKLAEAMKRRWAAKRSAAQAKKKAA